MLMAMLLSHAGDDAAKVTWPRRNVDVKVMLTIVLPSHAHDTTIDPTRLRRDVDDVSCRPQCCQVMLMTALSRRHGHDAM
jgi:hypothetical protein